MTSQNITTGRSGGRALLRGLLALAAAQFVLAACSSVAPNEVTGEVPDDYRRTHPIAIEENLETMDIPVGISSVRLPGATAANVEWFAGKFRRAGTGVIAVVAPSGSPNQEAAAVMAVQIEDTLRAAGVDGSVIEYRVYHARAHERNAPIRLAFNRIVAHTAPCGPFPDQLSENGENRNYHNFGCATQQNLAAMVASPLDLLYPRGMTPADATRRSTVLEKYRTGDIFTSDLSTESNSNVSIGVGQ